MNNSKIDSLVDQIIDKHEAQEDARSNAAYAKKLQVINFIAPTIVLAIALGPFVFVFIALFFI